MAQNPKSEIRSSSVLAFPVQPWAAFLPNAPAGESVWRLRRVEEPTRSDRRNARREEARNSNPETGGPRGMSAGNPAGTLKRWLNWWPQGRGRQSASVARQAQSSRSASLHSVRQPAIQVFRGGKV